MSRRMTDMLLAEVFQLRHRSSTWVLFGLWIVMGLFFGYVLPYLVETPGQAERDMLLPEAVVGAVVGGFPFYGGSIALMLGVLSTGSEFGWGTFKTLFTQGPGRGEVFAAKMGALGIVLVPFVLAPFVTGAAASAFIAWRDGAAIEFPPAREFVEAVLAGWLILAVWAALGVMLAVVKRGTSLAIGIGIIWALVIEGLLGAFVTSISWLSWVNDLMLRSNAYSLVEPLGGAAEADGPGIFNGPYLDVGQALLTLCIVLVMAMGVAASLLMKRDVA